MLPLHTAVRITNEDHKLDGEIAFINTLPGNETESGTFVPEGWYEIVLDPWGNGFQTELYREENLEICGC